MIICACRYGPMDGCHKNNGTEQMFMYFLDLLSAKLSLETYSKKVFTYY